MPKVFRQPHEAFASAIRAGVLTDERLAIDGDPNRAADYMYMWTEPGNGGALVDVFKCVRTREYVSAPVTS